VTEISRRLRAARELAGISIEDLAATTKIRRAALQAIERGEFERLPGVFYARAFLKAYAREVHLPPDEILAEYEALRAPAEPPAVRVAEPHRPVPDTRAAQSPGDHDEHPTPARVSWPLVLSSPGTVRAVVAVAAVLLVMTFFRGRPGGDRPHEPGAVGTSGVVEAAAATSVPSPRVEPAPDKLILEIHPAGPTWVTGAADGKRVLYRLLAPGEHITVEARDDLSFRIGNAVAFAYTINGLPGKPLGGPDEIREFRITRQNYRAFAR
jgi:transcriptional regulator with XRE-family HTH domain